MLELTSARNCVELPLFEGENSHMNRGTSGSGPNFTSIPCGNEEDLVRVKFIAHSNRIKYLPWSGCHMPAKPLDCCWI